jgi:hypothetical protein
LAKKSLVATNDSPTLPAPSFDVTESGDYTKTPYVFFASSKSPQWAALKASIPDVNEMDAVLSLPEPEEPVVLRPFRCFLLAAKQFWGEFNESGELLSASMEKDESFVETIETVLLVQVGQRLIPARCTFRRGMCPAIHTLTRAVKLASSPEWGEKSPEHAATLSIGSSNLRFVATIRSHKRTSKTSGRAYNFAEASIKPTSAADGQMLSRCNEEHAALVVAVGESFQRRVAEVEQLAG